MLLPNATSRGEALKKSASAARARDSGVCLDAGWVTPMRVGVVMAEIVAHRLDDLAWHLGAPRAVEVSDRLSMVFPSQSREVRPDGLDRREIQSGIRHLVQCKRDAIQHPASSIQHPSKILVESCCQPDLGWVRNTESRRVYSRKQR